MVSHPEDTGRQANSMVKIQMFRRWLRNSSTKVTFRKVFSRVKIQMFRRWRTARQRVSGFPPSRVPPLECYIKLLWDAFFTLFAKKFGTFFGFFSPSLECYINLLCQFFTLFGTLFWPPLGVKNRDTFFGTFFGNLFWLPLLCYINLLCQNIFRDTFYTFWATWLPPSVFHQLGVLQVKTSF